LLGLIETLVRHAPQQPSGVTGCFAVRYVRCDRGADFFAVASFTAFLLSIGISISL
jgi:hypothetical protein